MLGIAFCRNRLLTALIHSDRDGSNPLTQRLHGPEKQKGQLRKVGLSACFIWLRGQDSNLRPSGYEPDELPDCSTPRQNSFLRVFMQRSGLYIEGRLASSLYMTIPQKKRKRLFILFNRCRLQKHKPSTKDRYIDSVVGTEAKATVSRKSKPVCQSVSGCEIDLCILTGVAICKRLPALTAPVMPVLLSVHHGTSGRLVRPIFLSCALGISIIPEFNIQSQSHTTARLPYAARLIAAAKRLRSNQVIPHSSPITP